MTAKVATESFDRNYSAFWPRPRIVLADEHCVVAEGIALLLADRFDVVETVADGDALLDAARRIKPDLIVAEIKMPRRNGIDVLKALRTAGSRVPFVFLSLQAAAAVVASALRAGANGYVAKQAASTDLIDALGAALTGRCYVTPSLAAQHIRACRDEDLPLTARQKTVLRLIRDGKVTKQIARELNLSARTVECHRHALMQIFRVHSAVQLLRKTADLTFADGLV